MYFTPSAHNANTHQVIYTNFRADDWTGLTIDGWNNLFRPADEDSGIFVNESETAVAYPNTGGYTYQNAAGASICFGFE